MASLTLNNSFYIIERRFLLFKSLFLCKNAPIKYFYQNLSRADYFKHLPKRAGRIKLYNKTRGANDIVTYLSFISHNRKGD